MFRKLLLHQRASLLGPLSRQSQSRSRPSNVQLPASLFLLLRSSCIPFSSVAPADKVQDGRRDSYRFESQNERKRNGSIVLDEQCPLDESARRPLQVPRNKKKNVICFLGPPAAGKGSYTKLVVECFSRVYAESLQAAKEEQGRVREKKIHQDDAGGAEQVDLSAIKLPRFTKVVASDLIKKEIQKKTDIGLQMVPFMQRHEHVPSKLMVKCLKRYLMNGGGGRFHCGFNAADFRPGDADRREGGGAGSASYSFVLVDGFPRSLEQLEAFLERDSSSDASGDDERQAGSEDAEVAEQEAQQLDQFQLGCIHLDLKREWARAKAVGRLVCPDCDFPYNDAEVVLDDGTIWAKDLPEEPKCGHYGDELRAGASPVQEQGRGCSATSSATSSSCASASGKEDQLSEEGKKTNTYYPQRLQRRDSGEIFDKRYQIYLEKEAPVKAWFEERQRNAASRAPNTYTTFFRNVKIRGGYRVMADEIVEAVMEMVAHCIKGGGQEDHAAALNNCVRTPHDCFLAALEKRAKETAHRILDEWDKH